jgi:N-acetylmuramic acid 6-phosphate etherase
MEKTTESDSHYNDLENMSVAELLHNMNKEDKTVPLAIENW